MAKKKKDKLNMNVDISGYQNTDALIDDKMLRMQLANIRRSLHITQKQLADISGLSESCISNIESGESVSPTMRSVIKYAHALGVQMSVIYPDRDT